MEGDVIAAQRKTKQKPLDIVGVFPEIEQIQDRKLREAVVAIWQELWAQSPWSDFDTVPTSPNPYPTRPHNQCVVAMSLAVADAFERFHGVKVDRDVLIAAAVLQDASKVVEYKPDANGKAEFSELGKTYPHSFWCAHLALRHGVPIRSCISC